MGFKQRILKFKQDLALVFDDDLHTKKWINIVDYLIIAMILLSTAEIFLSTFDIDPALRRVLLWIEIGTLIFFTIEVTLRIWVAPLVDSRFKGWKGRLRYCFTFNGFVDVISTYPFFLQWLIPFPVTWMRAFRMSRTVRLFRLSRYMKSWDLLTSAIREKKRELMISMQFLLIVTFILSLILFFFEHERQPEVYDNGFTSVMWAFAQYIGDPGGFGDTPPLTVPGKIIACLVGLLGIAIVAVPAGIIGSGFTEAIEKNNAEKDLKERQTLLKNAFERKLDRPTGFQAVNFFRSIVDLQARTGMTQPEIVDTVKNTPGFRLVNLASTIPTEQNPMDRLAVEHFITNRPYGLVIDRSSMVTIVSPSSLIDPATGIFSFYLAMIGGFNYISREKGLLAPYKSYYTIGNQLSDNQEEYCDDLKRLVSKPGAWSLTFLAASGAQENTYDSQFHFGTGNSKGETNNVSPGDLITDKEKFQKLYDEFSYIMNEKYGLSSDHGKYHSTNGANIWPRKLNITQDSNNVILRMAWSEMLWNDKRLCIAQELAGVINRIILDKDGNPENPELKTKRIGYEGYGI